MFLSNSGISLNSLLLSIVVSNAFCSIDSSKFSNVANSVIISSAFELEIFGVFDKISSIFWSCSDSVSFRSFKERSNKSFDLGVVNSISLIVIFLSLSILMIDTVIGLFNSDWLLLCCARTPGFPKILLFSVNQPNPLWMWPEIVRSAFVFFEISETEHQSISVSIKGLSYILSCNNNISTSPFLEFKIKLFLSFMFFISNGTPDIEILFPLLIRS